ncbi:hypothetical protein CVT26_007644 [Gymnopilus dilepis]|uniref:F-box domain-containing protein n=1 Tax=Gymnopilus dilepis TaxID=231916 RepID=A0A409VZS7_9AGAR|nr:hypothetical protein CVT26_007644 [Gymnopilus dilepis]
MKILQLTNDNTLDIFFFNANVFHEESALQTALICSRVCTGWRALLLSTPSIWARVLDIRQLVKISSAGQAEILSRTGSAPLWVSAKIAGRGEAGDLLSVSLIRDHWSRIERLKLSISHLDGRELWPVLARPAPILRTFEVSTSQKGIMDTNGSETPLFSDHAPALSTFMGECLPLNLSAPWLQGIRQLCLGFHLSTFDILTCLQSTPQLEILITRTVSSSNTNRSTHLPTVTLPKLVKLYFQYVDLQDCMTLLRGIKIPESCSIVCFADRSGVSKRSDIDILSKLLKEAVPELSSYLQRFIQVHSSKISVVTIYLDSGTLIFHCDTDIRMPALEHTPVFVAALMDQFQVFSTVQDSQSLLPTLFSRCNFDMITTLVLDFFSILPLSETQLMTWFRFYFICFPSVQHLHVSEGTLQLVLALSQTSVADGTIVFPLMETLTVTGFDETWGRSGEAELGLPRPVVQFLRYRKAINLSVKTLIYDQVLPPGLNLKGLEDITGLRVRVRRRSLEDNEQTEEYILIS